MIKELENKIGQLQYEISLLGLDQEELTGVTIRTDELKDLVKNLSIHGVMHSNGVDKQEVLNDKNDIIEEHGCPYQEDVHGDYEFRCNCNDADTHECAMDI